jgi:GMP synthase-like glutamine amidotransferase
MNGGKLIQDLDGHRREHGMIITTGNHMTPSQYISRVSSTHHQAVIENDKMKVLGHVHQSERRDFNPSITQTGRTRDIEAFFYPATCFLGFQGHPEYANYHQYTQWCLQMIEKYIANNPNVKLDDAKRYRVTQEKQVILGLPGPVKENKK